jgi:hypothetical protein
MRAAERGEKRAEQSRKKRRTYAGENLKEIRAERRGMRTGRKR